MFGIDEYIDKLTALLKNDFGERLLYIGLQGSYLRGEATEKSDIDIMAVIDGLSAQDMKAYRNALVRAGDFDKSCGFICGREELKHWNALEICHLLHTTEDRYGKLDGLVPAYTLQDEINYVKLSLNNLYHELCHRYIHADREYNVSALPRVCKSVFYIMQNLHYLRSGRFVPTKGELLECVQGEDKAVLELAVSLQDNSGYDFDKAFSMLFDWCRHSLSGI